MSPQRPNPFGYLYDEERHGDGQAAQSIFLTFNADLGFFESRLLGLCLSSGARACLIADAGVWDPDAVATRHAGRAYHVGLASTAGAFHPKVAAIVGPKRAVVAIGSGNLTMGGWQHNNEIWTVFEGDTSQAPVAFGDIAQALDGIAALDLDPISTKALRTTAEELRGLLDCCEEVVDTGHRVLSSLSGPIIDELPADVAEELWLYAPFLDPNARAVAAIIERLQPKRVTVIVQPGLTVLEPGPLETVLERSAPNWEIRRDAEIREGQAFPPYRHGKLIEWLDREGRRYALTGSPNLSYAALMAAPGRGNVEIAVLAPIETSLVPNHEALEQQLEPVRIASPEYQALQPSAPLAGVLQAAILADDGLLLVLSRPLATDVLLQLEDPIERQWIGLASLSAGMQTGRVGIDRSIEPGSRVRLCDLSVPGFAGAFVPVSDQRLVERRRRASAGSRTDGVTVADFWGEDIEILMALSRDLEELPEHSGRKPAPAAHTTSAGGRPSTERPRTADTDASPWLWAQETTTARHGAAIAAFGLGLPTPPADDELTAYGVDDVDVIPDSTPGEEDDTAESMDEDGIKEPETDAGAPVDHAHQSAAAREKRRRWCRQWAPKLAKVPLGSQLVVFRFFLIFWTARNWAETDTEPYRLAETMLSTINDGLDGVDDELQSRAASVCTVALTVMHDRVDPDVANDAWFVFSRLRKRLAYLGIAATDDALDEYLRYLRRPSGMPLDRSLVQDAIDSWTSENPFADAVAILEADDHDITRVSARALRIDGAFSNPSRIAYKAMSHVTGDGPLGIWAVSAKGSFALVLWQRPDLITISSPGDTAPQWRHHRLPPRYGPGQPPAHFAVRHGPLTSTCSKAQHLLDELQIILTSQDGTGTDPL